MLSVNPERIMICTFALGTGTLQNFIDNIDMDKLKTFRKKIKVISFLKITTVVLSLTLVY